MTGWGGRREGAGRPAGWRKAEPNQRKHRSLVAFDDEWEAIKQFMKLVRKIGADNALTKIKDVQ